MNFREYIDRQIEINEAAPQRWGSGNSIESRRSSSLKVSSNKLSKADFAKIYWEGLLAKDEEWGGYFDSMVFDDEMKLMEYLDHFSKTDDDFDFTYSEINKAKSNKDKLEILKKAFFDYPDKQYKLFNKILKTKLMYRGIAIAGSEEDIDKQYLGTSWTFKEKTAAHWAKNMREKNAQNMFVLVAENDPLNIDMEKTAFLFAMWNNIDGQGECEIRVIDEEKIKLVEIKKV